MKKPNILLITTDQHHFTSLGIENPIIKTPNIDRLAEEGTIFTRTYCSNPTCTPCRASIITGMYPSQHGAWSLGTKLLEDVPTIGQILQDNDYETALIGKAHFEPLRSSSEFSSLESYPILQDSDFWKSFNGPYFGFKYIQLARNHTDEAHVGEHYGLWLDKKGLSNWKDYFLKPTGNRTYLQRAKEGTLWKIPEEFHYNAWISEVTNEKMKEYKENNKPFFLWASFLDPHGPRILPEPWNSMYDPESINVPDRKKNEHIKNPPHFRYTQVQLDSKNKLKRMFQYWIGALKSRKFSRYYLDFKKHGVKIQGLHGMHPHFYNESKLKKEIAAYYGMVSLLDKYVGKILEQLENLNLVEDTIVIFTTDHGDFFGQHGLLTKGPYHYEDLLKIPFIVRYPNVLKNNHRNDNMQSLVDFAPTMLKLLGIPIPSLMSGIDQSEVWKGNISQIRDHILCENHHSPSLVHLKSYVNEKYKITIYNNQKYGELFDLENDPDEFNNLWNEKDYDSIKTELLLKFLKAELGKDHAYRTLPK